MNAIRRRAELKEESGADSSVDLQQQTESPKQRLYCDRNTSDTLNLLLCVLLYIIFKLVMNLNVTSWETALDLHN